MDKARDYSRIGQGDLRVPSSLSDDELDFDSVFDWPAYCDSTAPLGLDHTSLRATPGNLGKLLTDIHPLIDSLQGHRFFDMGTSLGSDGLTTPDYSGHPSPPDLVQGEGSTSPSDHSDSVWQEQLDDVQHRSDISLRDFQSHDDKWTYPQSDVARGSSRKYPPELQVRPSRSTRQPLSNYQSVELGLKKRRRSPDKRPRHLADPIQTADVRRSGACLPCRVSKTRCHDNGVCPTCRKAFPDHSHLVCTRMSPYQAWPVTNKIPDVWVEDPALEQELCSSPHLFISKPRGIPIFFSREANAPPLNAVAQAYKSSDRPGDGRKIAFPRESVPRYEQLQRWVEDQIWTETAVGFRNALQRFLLAYAHDGAGLPRHGLVKNVHTMNCFFRIWKTSSFWCRDPSNNLVALPVSLRAELRRLALMGLRQSEGNVLKELEDCLAQQGPLKTQERMAIWACMWQIILIYRDLQCSFQSLIARKSATWSETVLASHKRQYKWLSDIFFPLITIFYHYQFRTKKSLEVSMDWLKPSTYPSRACHSKVLQYAAAELLSSRKLYCQYLQSSKKEADQLICVLVVNHELKKLNTRSRTKKTSSRSKGGAYADDCDDDEE